MSGLKQVGRCFVALLLAAVGAGEARASVVLTFDDGDLAPNDKSITIAPGQSFSVNLRLTAGAEKVSGVNYDVITKNATGTANVNGIFRLSGRSLTSPASAFGDTSGVLTDAEVAANNKTLSPDTTQNLGSTVPGSATVTGGTFQVSRLTFGVFSPVQAGTYRIYAQSPGNDPFVGYNGPPPASTDFPFDAPQAFYTVTVTPEPGVLALGAAGGALWMTRRSRRKACSLK